MADDLWIAFSGALIVFALLELVLTIRRRHKRRETHNVLIRAKQETQEVAQLPLKNPHPQIQITRSGTILFANPAAIQTFPTIETLGLSHPILANIEKEEEREVAFDDKIYQQTLSPTRVNGETSYVIYCYDITERKTYERDLQAAHKRAENMRQIAESAKEARGEFLANMSHELRTPMNGIIGLSEILCEMRLDGEKQDLIEAVNSSARNLLILLNDILDFSKIEAGELTIEKIPFDLRKIVTQIESLQRPMASQKGLTLSSAIAHDLPVFLIGDPSRLQQILNNLISNALKFTETGAVTLSISGTHKDTDHYTTHIAVTDTGIGIPKDKQAAIFEKFQQADASTARKYGGTGLGLAITKDLATLMGGTIAIESEENIGTTFTLTLTAPIAHDHIAAAPSPSAQNAEGGININATLMIVDDHPINLLFLRKTLSTAGFNNVDEATSGKHALELFKQRPYDLIIMDCQMPEMDGFEATRIIRETEDAQTAPIIVAATADAMKGAEERCIAAGMDDYISKPIDKEKLKHILQQWIPSNEEHLIAAIENDEKKRLSTPTNTDIIDWTQLEDFTSGDPEIEQQILTMFMDNLKTDMAALHKSYEAQNYEEWDSWVHKLYGACSHVGATALARICDQGQSLPADQHDEIKRTHQQIMTEYKRVEAALISKKAAA